jgi:hypothetical protein
VSQVDQPFEFVLPAHVDVVRDLNEKRLCVLADADANTPKLTQNEVTFCWFHFQIQGF